MLSQTSATTSQSHRNFPRRALTLSARNTYIGPDVMTRPAALPAPHWKTFIFNHHEDSSTEGNDLADDVLVIHRGLALMLCEDAAILEETLQAIESLDLHIRRLGARGLLVPADEIDEILETLHQEGTFPRVVGSVPTSDDDDETSPDESVAEEAL